MRESAAFDNGDLDNWTMSDIAAAQAALNEGFGR